MAAHPPPRQRRRARPGSLERPLNGRSTANLASGRVSAAPRGVHGRSTRARCRADAAADFDGGAATGSRPSSRGPSRPHAGIGGRAGAAQGPATSCAVRLPDPHRPFARDDPRARARPARNLIAVVPGAPNEVIVVARAPRQHRRRPGRERQRLRDRRSDRARTGLRDARRGSRRRSRPHDRLPLDRRRRVRRARRGAIRDRSPRTATASSRSSTSTRSPAPGRRA